MFDITENNFRGISSVRSGMFVETVLIIESQAPAGRQINRCLNDGAPDGA